MRSRLLVMAALFVLATITAVLTHNGTRGQGPAPKDLPPALLPATPIGPAAKDVLPANAAARKSAPFDRFRKYDELPDLTREFVFSTLRGMEWLSRHHQPNGRFVPGRNPALDTIVEEDEFSRQALGAFALARAARVTGDEKYAVRAAQTILSLLAEAPKDAANPMVRMPAQSPGSWNRIG